jgi:hypothetical protein
VILYSNLHQDLFNKERKQKEKKGNERWRRTNLARIIRSQQEFSGEKIGKRQEQGAAMFGAATPVLLYLGHAPLKGEGAKTVTRLTNACCPLLIKGDTH